MSSDRSRARTAGQRSLPIVFSFTPSLLLFVLGGRGDPISDRDYFKVRRCESPRLLCVDSTVNTSLPFLAAAKALLLFF